MGGVWSLSLIARLVLAVVDVLVEVNYVFPSCTL